MSTQEQARPDGAEMARRRSAARGAALARLKRKHEMEYRRYLNEEKTKRGL